MGGLLVSDDDGQSWSLIGDSSGKPGQKLQAGQIHPDVHSVASYAASEDWVLAPSGGGFYTSEDGGETWSLKYEAYCRAVWVDPTKPTHMVLGPADGVGRGGRIETTTDGGETWHLIMDNIPKKWPNTMVERFVSAEAEILGILSNGKVLTARTDDFSWQTFLPGIGDVVMLAVIEGGG